MKLISVLAGVLLWTTPLLAETYSWIDENGTYNFTEDYSRVPKKYRSKLDKREDMGASPAKGGDTPPAVSRNTPPVKTGSAGDSYGGKSYDQWKQEFREREAAMRAVTKRVEEIDALLNKSPSSSEQTRGLIAERNKAVKQFGEMRGQYDQQVELARKAGIRVDISQ